MSQACSQHPALAGCASQREVVQHGAFNPSEEWQQAFRCSRAGWSVMRLATSIYDDVPQHSLPEADPLPPDDRAPPSRPAALDALYREHASRLLRFFSRRTGKDDAYDLVHETFARFAGRRNAAAAVVERPEAYLSTVATNLLRDRAKVAARQALEHHGLVDAMGVASPDPHRLLEDRDALARLEVAVARLRPRRRRIFLLHRVEQLTYADIANEVGMSVKGVKKQMAKAFFELRRDMGPL